MSLMDGAPLADRSDAAREPLIVVTVGSRIRFNTGLLQHIDHEPAHQSRLVEIERLIREVDGSITLWLKNAAGVVDGIA